MIAFVKGLVTEITEDGMVLDVGGVGIGLLAPLTQLQPAPVIGEPYFLHTHLQVREDAWTLFGFSDREQLTMFRLLLNVSGIGAKSALAIVDHISTGRFGSAVEDKDLKTFTSVPGIGKKTAERILLELKDKVDAFGREAAEPAPGPEEELNSDLLAALKQLGYTATEARAFTLAAQNNLGPGAGPEQLLREALKIARNS